MIDEDIGKAFLDAGFGQEADLIKGLPETNVENKEVIKDEQETSSDGQESEKKAETNEKVLTDFEKEQQAKGWNPEGEKSAEEWLRAQPLYDEIKKRGKEIKQLQRTVDNMKSVMEKQTKLAYEQAIKDLEAKQTEAYARGDTNAANQLQEQIETAQEPVLEQELPQEAYDFAERNASWMNGTSYEEMKIAKFARERDSELALKKLDPVTHIETLEEHIRKEFPDYFGIQVKPSSQAVESGTGTGFVNKSKKNYTMNDLNQEQKQCAYDFERTGVMPKEAYIKLLADSGELK